MFRNSPGPMPDSIATPEAPTSAVAKRGMFSVLGPDIVVTGNIAATADLQIDGRVDGDVDCGGLVQGGESRIAGRVKADSARLAGTVEGSVAVRQLVIERAARISGDVDYETITIETGATIDGRLKHVSADAAGRTAATRPYETSIEERINPARSDGEAAA